MAGGNPKELTVATTKAARARVETEAGIDAMIENPKAATGFLKALAHEGRLLILCHLLQGERSVGEIEALLGVRQAAVSQQLARLRLEGLVAARREGKTIYYRLGDPKVRTLIEAMHELFCAASAP